MDRPINGIWFNKDTKKVLRVNSPYYKDEVAKSNWEFLTPGVNMTLLKIREIVAERGLADEPTAVTWT
jgi:hypothetical protein